MTTLIKLPSSRRSIFLSAGISLAVLTGVSFVEGVVSHTAIAIPFYELTDLGSPSPDDISIRARSINGLGQIIGRSARAGEENRAFFWSEGQFVPLSSLTYSNGDARAFTERGTIVGTVNQVAGVDTDSAIVWKKSGETFNPIYLGVFDRDVYPGAYETYFRGVNELNLAVGNTLVDPDGDPNTPPLTGTAQSYPFAYDLTSNRKTNLPGLSALTGFARAVNDRGEIAGSLTDPTLTTVLGARTAVVWRKGGGKNYRITQITPGFEGDSASINSLGQVTGQYKKDGINFVPFLWKNRRITNLGTLGGVTASPAAINARTIIVGSSATSSGINHAFVWESGTIRDLNNLLVNAAPGWELTNATGINDQGTIVGYGNYTDTSGIVTQRSFILAPAPGVFRSRPRPTPRPKVRSKSVPRNSTAVFDDH
jgi:probable HAF family extracellular repeat protein